MFSCLLVGTDGSDTAGKAVHMAIELARMDRAELHIVSAYRVAAALGHAGAGGSPGDLAAIVSGPPSP